MFKITITPVEEQSNETGGHAVKGQEQEFNVPDAFMAWLEKALNIESNEDGTGGRLLRHGLVVDYAQVETA